MPEKTIWVHLELKKKFISFSFSLPLYLTFLYYFELWDVANREWKVKKKKGSRWKKEERKIKAGRVEMFNRYRADG